MNGIKRVGRGLVAAVLGLGVAVLLVACGGGGGAGDSVFGGGGQAPTTLVDLAVVADKVSVPNTGADFVTFTVTALTTGNAALTGVTVPVTVSVDAGAVVLASSKSTDTATGSLQAKVTLTDRTSRTVTITATSGSITKQATFKVVDSITGSQVADLSVVVDNSSLVNTGDKLASITVTALDAGRGALGGIPVAMEVVDAVASGGAVLLDPTQTATDATSGQLTRRLALQGVKTNRSVAVKATSGTVSRTVIINIVDPPAGTVLRASDLTMSLNKLTIGNAGSETVDVVVTAVDANRNAISGIPVQFKVDSGAIVIVPAATTDSKGQSKASVLVGADHSNRIITVTATSDTLVRQAAFAVTGAKLQAQLIPGNLNAGAAGKVEYTLTDSTSGPMATVPIEISGPGAASSKGFTDATGKYVYNYVAVGNGPTLINAAAGGVTIQSTVQINANVPVVPAATNILSATFTASPNVVRVNQVGKTDNRSELRLQFLSDKNQPVKDVRARIGFGTNASSTDGDISSGQDQVVYSDANGVALMSFIAGQRSSSTEQVKVFACFSKDDTVETIAACPAARLRTVSLTVVEPPVSVSIGTNNLIGEGSTKLTYIQDFTVLVVDAAGNPKSDVQVSPVIDLAQYEKGYWTYDSANKVWVQTVTTACANEDANTGGFRNGTIEPGEDINGNGQLDPRKSDVSVAMLGSTKTDVNGLATVRIEYPQSHGSWVEFAIRASASGVVSPPAWFGRTPDGVGAQRWLGVPITVVKAEATPPFALSPYGKANVCSDPN